MRFASARRAVHGAVPTPDPLSRPAAGDPEGRISSAPAEGLSEPAGAPEETVDSKPRFDHAAQRSSFVIDRAPRRMNPFGFPHREQLWTFADGVRHALLSTARAEIAFPESCRPPRWPGRTITGINSAVLDSLDGDGNIYAFFTREADRADWFPVYVGQRTAHRLRERIRQHLVGYKGTGTKTSKIRKAVSDGKKIGISWIKVEPDSLRLTVEDMIIASMREEDDRALPWNRWGLADKLDRIALDCASLPAVDNRSADEILGYDEYGLPS